MDKVAFLNFLSTAKSEGATGEQVAALLKQATGEQVDPRELEALMSQMPAEAQGAPGGQTEQGGADNTGAPPLSDEQLAQVAQMVAQILQQQEAQAQQGAAAQGASQGGEPGGMEGLPPEAQQAMGKASSADYIEGFLKRACEYGLDINQGVNLYCESLSNLKTMLKSASAHNLGVVGVINSVDEPTLAYFQGIAEKAASDNLTYEQTLDILKAAGADKMLKEKFTNKQ